MDKKKIAAAVRLLIEAIGEDPERDGLKQTPQRVADFFEEIFSGVGRDPKEALKLYSTPNQDEMIILKDIPFYSLCEHHLLPFFGKAHIAYIPNENKITGFSSLARVVEASAHRLQLQERLATEIADVIMEVVQPKGVLVVIEAEQLCLTMRGIKKPGSLAVTSAIRGAMHNAPTRAEAFALIKGKA